MGSFVKEVAVCSAWMFVAGVVARYVVKKTAKGIIEATVVASTSVIAEATKETV